MMSVFLAGGLGDYIFGLDAQLLFDTAITMLSMFAMFLLLSYLLFNPARDLMAKRQQKIKDDMENATNEKADAIAFKEEYEEKLKNVDTEAEEILRETRKKALKKENDIIAEAQEEAARIIERANKEVELEKSKVKDEVKQQIIAVATAMAGKIVAVSLSEDEQARLIADTLKEMGDDTWLS